MAQGTTYSIFSEVPNQHAVADSFFSGECVSIVCERVCGWVGWILILFKPEKHVITTHTHTQHAFPSDGYTLPYASVYTLPYYGYIEIWSMSEFRVPISQFRIS